MLISTVGKRRLIPREIPNVSVEVRAMASLGEGYWGFRTASPASPWLKAAPAGTGSLALPPCGGADSYWPESPQVVGSPLGPA